jgi:hypothetical protein
MSRLIAVAAALISAPRKLVGGGLLVLVLGAGFGGVVAVDASGQAPAIEREPEQKLVATASEENERGRFGSDVAISGDGTLALVGAPDEDGGVGAVWTFTRSQSGWSEQGPELTVPTADSEAGGCTDETSGEEEEAEEGEEVGEEPGEEEVEQPHPCNFGRSVALSEDGSTAVVGVPRENGNSGAVWIYTRSGSSWTQPTELGSPEPGLNRRFGVSVAVSAGGTTIAVGAPRLRGRVWVFRRSGSSWVPIGGGIAGTGEEGEGFFGHSVALSGDGETLVAGAPSDDEKQGAAWIFTRSGSGWAQQGSKITGAGESGEGRFGSSVALSADGNTALVGAHGNDEGSGAVWAYDETDAGWVQQGPALNAGGQDAEAFGDSVALSADGATALVGANDAEENRGAAWIYERTSGGWQEQAKLATGSTEQGMGRFGSSVALSAEGQWLLVGGAFDQRLGAVWAFGSRPTVTGLAPAAGPSSGGTEVTISGENLSGATAVRFGSVEAASFRVLSQKSIVAVSPSGMGTVPVTVESELGVSFADSSDQFTYKISTGVGGGKGKEVSGGGTDSGGSSGGSSGAGTDTPTASGPSSETVVLGFGAVRAPVCGASLLSKSIVVQRNYSASFRLLGAGVGKCAGKLTLQVRLKLANKRYRTKTIGAASFSVAASKRVAIKVRLNRLGRALLKSRHGRLSAKLVIVKSSPAPTRAQTASVRLRRL